MEVLANVRVVNLDVSLWTGRKKLRPTDINLTAGELPPEELASLGSKKTVSPESLAPFTKIKARMTTALSRAGVRFLGGYAIPETKAEEVCKDLEAIVAEGMQEKALFLANYDDEVRSWRAKNRRWEQALIAGYVPREVVERQIRFAFQTFRIEAPKGGTEDAGLQASVNELGNQLLEEVAADAAELFERSLTGKDTVNRRVLMPIRTLRGKLDGLSFTHPCVSPIVIMIDETLDAMPDAGPITGAALSALHGLLLILSDSAKMVRHGEAIINGTSVDDAEPDAESDAPSAVDAGAFDDVPADPAAEVSEPEMQFEVPPAVVAVAPSVAVVEAEVGNRQRIVIDF